MSPPRRPGLAKTREQPLLVRRSLELWQSSDYRWRELFEAADVMSEGATRSEREGAYYYGTTSVLLPTTTAGGALRPSEVEHILGAARLNPHARVRAIRIAYREALVRAAAPLGRLQAELVIRSDPRGVCFDVDVVARVFLDEKTAPAPPARTPRRTGTAR